MLNWSSSFVENDKVSLVVDGFVVRVAPPVTNPNDIITVSLVYKSRYVYKAHLFMCNFHMETLNDNFFAPFISNSNQNWIESIKLVFLSCNTLRKSRNLNVFVHFIDLASYIASNWNSAVAKFCLKKDIHSEIRN